MPALDQLFKTIESYDKMNIQYLQFSKIGKVMRHVTALEEDKVPRDAEYKFRDRAKSLVDKWHMILHKASDGVNGDASTTTTTTKEKANNNKGSSPEADGKADAVADKTAALDINGNSDNNAMEEDPKSGGAEAVAVNGTADESTVGDVTMSEA